MTLSVKIVTTANRTLNFVQSDEAAIQDIIKSLGKAGQLFAGRTLIIGSDKETQIIAPGSLTRIEIETQRDLQNSVPQMNEAQKLTLIEGNASTPPSGISDTHIATRVDCFFEGGDTLALWIEGPRPNNSTDRMSRMTRLFDLPVMIYRLPAGGIGLLNPAKLTRIRLDTAADQLPVGTWQLNPAG